MISKEIWEQEIPQIDWAIVVYEWLEYQLIRISEDWVEQTGTPLEIAKWWLLRIEGDKIWWYWIPEAFLLYTIINEIECPNVLAWGWLCLKALQIELEVVPKDMYSEYLPWRIKFFRNMEKYYQLDDFKDESYANEMRKCYEYLDELEKKRNIIWDITQSIVSALE